MLVRNDCDRRNGRIAELTIGATPVCEKWRPPGTQCYLRYVVAIVLAETTLRANVCYPNSLRLWLKLWLRQVINARLGFCESCRYFLNPGVTFKREKDLALC